MTHSLPIRRALVSVYDKTGLEELARALADAGVEIVSTGSTAARIAASGVAVTTVDAVTGFPECLDGRVKTLHPAIHAGILADRRLAEHVNQLDELGIAAFDLVVVNLYPFEATVAAGASDDEAVEQIDIGGPTMVRAAAKNHPSVAVVVNPAGYGDIVRAVQGDGFTFDERRQLAAAAFRHTADYDIAVASWMTSRDDDGTLPRWLGASFERSSTLRYGENPHQEAALYRSHGRSGGIAAARQLGGKEMSFNNFIDADAAIRAAYDHALPAVAIIKHANPCGIAIGESIADAYVRAHETDPVSAFGGVIAANSTLTAEAAERIAPVFTEVVVAPGFEPRALEILTAKKNLRILEIDPMPLVAEWRRVTGGLLVQATDAINAPGDDPADWVHEAGPVADAETLRDLVFAWRACRAVKSNAILLAKGGAAVGIGMGQVNRVDSCRLAVSRAGESRAAGAVAASDAFFPFPDGLLVLAEAGVRAVVSPGGSIRDGDVIAAARDAGITLYHTGTRHFFH